MYIYDISVGYTVVVCAHTVVMYVVLWGVTPDKNGALKVVYL